MPRFFVRNAGVDVLTLEANVFFLVYHGGGLSKGDVDGMTADEIFRYSKRLMEQKQSELKAHEEAMRAVDEMAGLEAEAVAASALAALGAQDPAWRVADRPASRPLASADSDPKAGEEGHGEEGHGEEAP